MQLGEVQGNTTLVLILLIPVTCTLPKHHKNIMSSKESLEIEVQCTRLQAVRFMLNRKSLYLPMQPLTMYGTVKSNYVE
jgi:hypothetical protein